MSLPFPLRKLARTGLLTGMALSAFVHSSQAEPTKIRLSWAVAPAQLARRVLDRVSTVLG